MSISKSTNYRVKNFVLVIISLTLSLFFADLILANYETSRNILRSQSHIYQDDDRYGWKFIPGLHSLNNPFGESIEVSVNKDGFRGNLGNRNASTIDTKKVIFIGDSVTAGMQVNDGETFSDLLNELSKGNFETYNFGINGFSTDQSLLVLEDYIEKISPDFVVYTFVLNDPEFNLEKKLTHNGYSWGKPFFDQELVFHKKEFSKLSNVEYTEKIKNFFRENSSIYRLLSRAKNKFVANKSSCSALDSVIDRYSEYKSKIWKDRWAMTEKLILKMKEMSESNDAKFLMVDHIEPAYADENVAKELEHCGKKLNSEININAPRIMISNIANRLSLTFVQTSFKENYQFTKQKNCDLNFLTPEKKLIDGHLTKCGHELLATKLFRQLRDY